MNNGHDNPSFTGDHMVGYSIPGEYRRNITQFYPGKQNGNTQQNYPPPATFQIKDAKEIKEEESKKSKDKEPKERDSWGKGIEFTLSCIAMSVGLGNIWRFPFTALENGGGAFVIPYLIILLLVGKPIYFMEMVLGQFSSRGSVKVFDCVPAMRGVGFGQVVSIGTVATYYASLMALTLKYFFESFRATLPWSECKEQWSNCIASSASSLSNVSDVIRNNQTRSSAELYFLNDVLKEKANIDDGIGTPDLSLTLFLVLSWSMVFVILVKGVKSSGKASYVLAIFPYIVLGILLTRALTLPGSFNGIIYFLKPQWDQILNPKVWYAAVTQVFFSLSVCFGNIIMYSSYNKFTHNVYRDATIVTTLDTFTSLLAGCTIFGILGHLAHEIGTDDIASVVKGGTGLAFISYPDAIAKFKEFPQVFSVLFFLMLFMLGIGSNIAMMSCIMTVIRDRFKKVKNWQAAGVIAIIGIALGSIYVTPGGQFVLRLVDYYGASFVAFVLAIAELITFGWIYGVPRFCKDTEFMLGFRPNLYWRLCWRYITPGLMSVILLYTLVTLEPVTYDGYVYPQIAYTIGWCISGLGLIQLPIFAIYAIYKQKGDTLWEKVKGSFRPTENWGPLDPQLNKKYKEYINQAD